MASQTDGTTAVCFLSNKTVTFGLDNPDVREMAGNPAIPLPSAFSQSWIIELYHRPIVQSTGPFWQMTTSTQLAWIECEFKGGGRGRRRLGWLDSRSTRSWENSASHQFHHDSNVRPFIVAAPSLCVAVRFNTRHSIKTKRNQGFIERGCIFSMVDAACAYVWIYAHSFVNRHSCSSCLDSDSHVRPLCSLRVDLNLYGIHSSLMMLIDWSSNHCIGPPEHQSTLAFARNGFSLLNDVL